MLSEGTKNKMLVALSSTVRAQGKEYWDDKSIRIVTGAINYGKELRGHARKSIGTAVSDQGIED
ncbi:hypothetical protein KKG81_04460, partial [bacterium]|nr:hypothetical protein [bacterium]